MKRSDDTGKNIAQLEAQIKELSSGLELMQARVEELEEQVSHRDKKIRSLEMEKKTLLRRLYGPKSDRPGDEAQMLLEGIVMGLEARPAEEAAQEEVAEVAQKKKKKRSKPTGRQILPEHLERRVEEVDLSEEEKIDPETGQRLILIGWESRERLVEEPARFYVQVLKRAKYARPGRGDGGPGQPAVITAPEPEHHGNPIDRCKADVSVLANIIVFKYCYHLTLYRLQERYWRCARVWLPRSTLCGWVSGCAVALEAIYFEMKRRILISAYLGLDDTLVKMLDPGAGKAANTRLWVYAGLLESAPYLLYDFTLTREKEGVLEFLGDFQGHLQGDAYSGHHEMMHRDGVIEVACWDHGRRYFVDASDEDPSAAAEALAHIKLLYKVERELVQEDAERRRATRQERSVPVLDKLEAWLKDKQEKYLPKSGMRSAINYCLNQWEALKVYTTDGNIPISNCLCEQSFKAIATGRKNWLFFGSEEGGRNAAILFSITMTCRRLDLDPYAYLEDVLRRVNTHPADRIEELLPDHWKRQREASGQDVRLRLEDHRPLRVAS